MTLHLVNGEGVARKRVMQRSFSFSSHCSLKEALRVVLERCSGMTGTQVCEPPLSISPWASGIASLASESPGLVTVCAE